MARTRTALRSLGVLAAASGLALAGAGAASATISAHDVDGNTVSVTFTLEDGDIGDVCGAALVPPTAIGPILDGLDLENPADIFAALGAIEGVTLLTDGGATSVTLGGGTTTGTVSADDVAGGVYALAAVCASTLDELEPEVITVGSPFDVIGGLSSGGLLESGSALLQGGEGTGQLDLATLSSAFGDTDE